MLRSLLKFALGLIGTLIAIALVALLSLSVWVMTGPKELSKVTPYIQSSLNNQIAPYRVSIDNALFAWDSWLSPIDFRLREVTLHAPDSTPLLVLNELSLKLDIPSLLRFKIVPQSVVLHRPTLNIYQNESGQFIVGLGGTGRGIPLSYLAGSLGTKSGASGESIAGSIQRIAISHGRLTLGNSADEAVFDAPDANLEITRAGDAIHAILAMDMQSDGGVSNLTVTGEMKPGDELMVAQARLTRFSLHLLSKLFPSQPEWAALNMPLNGEAAISVDAAGNLTALDFKVEGKKGVFNYPEHFAAKIPIKSAVLEGQFRNNLHQLLLNQANFDFFGGTTLSLNGFAMLGDEGWSYDALAVAENMPVNDLYKYWPKTLGPTPYHWVTKHIREGVVPRAEARISVAPTGEGEPLAEEALDVNIQVEGATVEYLEGHPKVQNVKGMVTFTGKGMEITSRQGNMLTGTKLNDAYLSIPDLAAEKPEMHIKLAIEAPAADVATYLSIPELNYAAPLGLDPATISGTASGTMQFDFLLPDVEHPEEDSELRFTIASDLANAAQPGFMGEGDLSDVNGKLVITEKQVDYHGAMTLDGAPLRVALVHSFDENLEYPTVYKAIGNLTVPQLKAFGLPELPFLKGTLGLSAEVKRNPTGSTTTGVVDATQVAALLPEIGFSKTAGQAARITFSARKKGDALNLESFELQGKDMAAKGSASAKENFAVLEKLELNTLRFGQNDFSGMVQQVGDGYLIRAKGKSVDLSAFFDDKDKSEKAEDNNHDLPFPIDLQAELGTLVLGEKRSMYNVNGRFKCLPKYCESVDFRGVTAREQPELSGFNYKIARQDGVRKSIISAQNAGEFLRAMDLYDSMKGGVLTIQGAYDDSDPQRPMKGTFEITENNIINAPALAKLASMLSLSGIANTMTGKGINFDKIVGNITMTDDYILVKDGKAVGSALGITFENGLINRKNDSIHFNGTVVPSYTLNSAVGNIPVIGQVLSGGEGEGIFAATYKMEGTYPDKVEVSVNPLTMLAPGFLRNLFGSSEEPELPKPQERLPGESKSDETAKTN